MASRPLIPDSLKAMNGFLYFVFADNHGWELWRSDGTTNGTFMLRDIMEGTGDSNPAELTDVNGELYFTADDGVHGRELWGSDGTTNGTELVEDLVPGPEPANPSFLRVVNGTLYYFANDGGDDLSLRRLTTTQVPGACKCALTATFNDGTVTISWPCNSSGCILEATDDLLDPVSATVWSPVSPQPSNGSYTEVPKAGRRYFRLRAQ